MNNPLGVRRIHHVELFVGNAKQAAYYYQSAFGFAPFAYRGLETGHRAAASYALRQGEARLVLTAALRPDHPAAEHVRRHGDGVRDIAFQVEDADRAWATAVERGATSAAEPRDLSDERGTVRCAAVHAAGDTIHSFLSYGPGRAGGAADSVGADASGGPRYDGPFLPGFQAPRFQAPRSQAPRFQARDGAASDVGLLGIDHLVTNVELGRMNAWADWYTQVFGFERYLSFDDQDISTEYSALMSIVMADDRRVLKMPINEPAEGRRKSQIDEFLEFHGGPGVQHLALLTRDIVATVRALRANGVEFLEVPDTYYDALPDRVGVVDEDLATLRSLGVLVDRDEDGYLLQLFTLPVEDRPTLFFEIIQRKGSRGFGKGNFRALFESIEREQARRGNL
jgi:4-hydroxyphenylpyruvate dioxygenase